MICRSCLRAASRSSLRDLSSIRSSAAFSTTTALRNATPISTNTATQSTPGSSPPPATSTSAAQPFSAPLTPAPVQSKADAAAEKKAAAALVRSSIVAGTPLKGLNFLKDRSDPVALPDDEYPDWLWTILDRQEKKGDGAAAGDLFSKSKKQRRVAAKRLRKEQLANPDLLAPKIPVYEQTIDLPVGDGSVEARDSLTKAMRNKRRADIKEKNFLKAMG